MKNTVKELFTITYIIFFLTFILAAINGSENAVVYLCLGCSFLAFAEAGVKEHNKKKKINKSLTSSEK